MFAHLLIADSDTFVLERCFRYFTDRGFQVETASDGLQCLRLLRELPPDILVLQRELLWGGGDGVLAWLREDSPSWPKTVVLTTDDRAAEDPLLSPVKAVLPRPFSIQTLSESIRRAHDPARNVATLFLRQADRLRPQDLRAQSRICFFEPGDWRR